MCIDVFYFSRLMFVYFLKFNLSLFLLFLGKVFNFFSLVYVIFFFNEVFVLYFCYFL